MLKKILTPTDDSDLARQTAQWTVTYAKECGAQISVFFVMPQCASDDDGDSGLIHPMLPDNYASTVKKRARRHLGKIERKCAEAGVACSAIDAAIELACTSDEPHEAIIREASGSTAPESSHWWPD
ncbi:universal stress protein [Rhodoferax sp.]|uniref:universal stress protein n=1 Tax=Rhodoferax sp. TaxID=50421 RepID=UPI00344B1B6F